ncbi:hypothetical protein LR48_Vigan07g211100 [Vigna angularis]|uniref:Putative plant transposon protein domain-containing protein n=1 Tax=Phaseolus angularis TaxID=3914 RepID=A0A0L9V0L1_PHAAN|nr:hypothetical protein LR48_Vigan07g211100 [Vigna angularis]
MTSSSQPSRGSKGKEIAVTRGVDLEGWISDDDTRERFLRGRVKIVVTPKHLDLKLFEKEGFQFPGWLETQELSTIVQMKGDWFPNLVRVFYHNLKIVNDDIWSRVKGVNIHTDNDVWLQVVGLKAEGRDTRERLYMHEGLKMEERITTHLLAWVILPGRMMQDEMTTEDVYLLHAIKNDIPTNWVEVHKDHMAEASLSNSHYLPYVVLISKLLILQGVNINGEQKCSCNCTNVINQNTIASLGLVKTVKGWCFKGEEDLSYSSGSTPAANAERTNFFPETNFERFVAEQFRTLNDEFNNF